MLMLSLSCDPFLPPLERLKLESVPIPTLAILHSYSQTLVHLCSFNSIQHPDDAIVKVQVLTCLLLTSHDTMILL